MTLLSAKHLKNPLRNAPSSMTSATNIVVVSAYGLLGPNGAGKKPHAFIY